METLQNMALLGELIRCGGEIYTWCYQTDGTLLRSNCPDEAILAAAFTQLGCKQRMLDHTDAEAPILLGTAIGLNWYADFERRDGKLLRCWLIGPVFYRDLSMRAVEQGFAQYNGLEISVAWKMRFLEVLKKIPVASNMIMMRYALMLHYCLTGEHLGTDALTGSGSMPTAPQTPTAPRDRHRVYMAERALLDMVRNGDLNYRDALNTSSTLSSGTPVNSPDPLRQAKTGVVVFATLISRAAMDGGLSPEEAYTVSDDYIQMAEDGKTTEEIYPISGMMYDDFIHRVHRMRTNPQYSPTVQRCCEYIEMNPEKKILARDLALATGYSEYYLTDLFKKETGLSVSNYVKAAKIERAKTMLRSSDDTVTEIAEKLGFTTRSYFSQVFTQMVGQTPQAYREGSGK